MMLREFGPRHPVPGSVQSGHEQPASDSAQPPSLGDSGLGCLSSFFLALRPERKLSFISQPWILLIFKFRRAWLIPNFMSKEFPPESLSDPLYTCLCKIMPAEHL